MRQLAKLMALLLALLMAVGSVASAGAQGTSDEPDLANLEGLEKFYVRSAALDFNAAPADGPAGSWVAMVAGVAQFDSEEHAAAGAAAIEESGAVQAMTAQGDVEAEAVELELDFEHVASRASNESEGVTYTILQSVAQDGTLVSFTYGWAMDHDPTEKVTATMEAMHGAEPSGDPEAFNADGTSTGGLWAVLPALDDLTAGADGLTVFEDSIEFPVQDEAGG